MGEHFHNPAQRLSKEIKLELIRTFSAVETKTNIIRALHVFPQNQGKYMIFIKKPLIMYTIFIPERNALEENIEW